MMRILKFAFISMAMAADTCSNQDDGECADTTSVLQIHHQESQSLARVFDQSAPEYPEPEKDCDAKLGAKAYFNTVNLFLKNLTNFAVKDKEDITDTIYTSSTRVWKNFITKCETELNLTVTGTVSGISTTAFSGLQCVKTNSKVLPTKWTAVVGLTIAELGFYGTGSSQLVRTKPDDKKCLIGSLPKVSGTVGATFNNISVTALVSVSGFSVTNVTDVYLTMGRVNQIKCGASEAFLDFMNKICSLFLSPIANLIKKPVVQIINNVINEALDEKFSDHDAEETAVED